MPRKKRIIKRKEQQPDLKYNSKIVAKFINFLMIGGKKSVAERILYEAFDLIEKKTKKNPCDIFAVAVKNATILAETKTRRIGAVNYQIPVETRPERGIALGMKNMIKAARKNHSIKGSSETLANVIMDTYNGTGDAIKYRDDTHKMAEANKGNAKYRW